MQSKIQDRYFGIAATLLGTVAIIGSLLISLSVFKNTSSEIENQIKQNYLTKAQLLVSLAAPAHGLSDSALLVQMQSVWESDPTRSADEYICIVDRASNLILHSSAPQTVGDYAGNNRLIGEEKQTCTTLGQLTQAPDQYVGGYISSSGEEQIVAFLPVLDRGWILGVHRSKRVFEENIATNLNYLFMGMLAISLGVHPLAFVFLYLSFIRINRDRVAFEKALHLAEVQCRNLIEGSTDLVTRVDKSGKFIFVNHVSEKILGLSPEECVGLMAFDFVFEADRDSTKAWFEKWTHSNNPSSDFENRQVNKKTGDIRWIHWTATAEFDDQGLAIAINSMGRDITKRKQIEIILEDSERRYLSLVDQSPVAYEVYDADGLQLKVNKAYEDMWGMRAEDSEGIFNVRTDPQVEILGLKPYVESAFAGESVTLPIYEWDPKKSGFPGRARLLSTRIYPLKDKVDTTVNVVITHEDITERVEAERELQESERKFKAMAEKSPLAIYMSSGLDQIGEYINPTFTKLFGYEIEEVPTVKDWWPLAYPDDNYRKQIEEEWQRKVKIAIETQSEIEPIEVVVTCKDGSTKNISWGFSTIGDQNWSFGLDLTELKQAETQRREMEAQLRQSQKLEAIGTMVGGISHEFNNVLQSMFLYGGLVQSELPENEELRSNFQHILDSGNRARDLIHQILTFSRKAKVEMKSQPLHEMLLEVLVLERASLPANIDIQQDIDMNCGMVLCDKTQIHQIMINLCNNAQHAMEEKGGTLTVSLKQIQASLNNSESVTNVLELTVNDTGHGIDAADLAMIFDPFFTTKQFGQGTGLGLSVIHGIIEMMGGQISVTSEIGRGATFRILLPVTEAVQEEEFNKSDGNAGVNHLSILLVDDEDDIREVTQVVLIQEGHLVDSASDGQQALELFKANPEKYDLIVTDQSMPKMSGVELTKAIRTTNSVIPIMLSTGQLGIEDEKEFKNAGITAFIQKPWTADALIDRILELDAE